MSMNDCVRLPTIREKNHNRLCSQRKIQRKHGHGRKKVLKRFGFGKKQHTLKECFRDFAVVANTVQEFEALT